MSPMKARVGEVFCLGFRGLRVPEWLRGFAGELGLGAAILFDRDLSRPGVPRNVESPAQVRAPAVEVLTGRPADHPAMRAGGHASPGRR